MSVYSKLLVIPSCANLLNRSGWLIESYALVISIKANKLVRPFFLRFSNNFYSIIDYFVASRSGMKPTCS